MGGGPEGITFDGANIWTANYLDNTLTKLRASDGAPLGTFPVGAGPLDLAFDGTNIWVTNLGPGTVTKLRASDGIILGTFNVGDEPYGVGFDGVSIWVANENSNDSLKDQESEVEKRVKIDAYQCERIAQVPRFCPN